MDHSTPAPRPIVYAPPPQTALPVVHVDEALLVLDKPSGLLTVPGKLPGREDCLEARAKAVHPTARVVHRLDLDTSGVIVLALTHQAQRHLGRQFEKRRTSKTYIARVDGLLTDDEGEIDLPLICDWPNRPRQMVDHENGKPALTRWRVLEREANVTRVLLEPVTGRSHQLRVHMLSLGHPILGDNLYAPDTILNAADRLQLHAESLSFRHPIGGAPQTFRVPCPF